MKRFICSMVILACFSNCGQFRKQTDINFDVTYHGVVAVPEASSITNGKPFPPSGQLVCDFPVVAVATESQRYLDEYHVKRDHMKKVQMLLFRLENGPTKDNFNYVDSIRIYASTSDLPEQMIARKTIIPQNTWRLDLIEAPNINLKDYFLQDTIYYRAELYIHSLPAQNTKLELIPTMYVEAKSVL